MKRALAAGLLAALVLSACALETTGRYRHVCMPDSAICWLENGD